MTDQEKLKYAKDFTRRTDGAAQILFLILQFLIEWKEEIQQQKIGKRK